MRVLVRWMVSVAAVFAVSALAVPRATAGEIQVGTGWTSKFVLDSEGRVWGWGSYSSDMADDLGYTPDSHSRSYYEPTLLPTLPPVKDIAFSGVDSAVLDLEGRLWVKAWRTGPWTQIGVDSWRSVFPSEKGFFAVRGDGTLWSQGRDDYGSLGISGDLNYRPLTQVGGGAGGWASVSSGRYHTLAIREDGSLHSWGRNYHGCLGTGETEIVILLEPQPVGAPGDVWVEAEVGLYFSLGLKADGSLWMWGSQVGSYPISPVPMMIDPGPFATIAAGNRAFLAVKPDGSVWGAGAVGLDLDGDGRVSVAYGDVAPALVNLLPAGTGDPRADALEANSYEGGDAFILARPDGSVLSWGDNAYGQAGIGSSAWLYEPVMVAGPGVRSSLTLGGTATILGQADGTFDFLGTGSVAGMGVTGFYSTPISAPLAVSWPAFDLVSCGMRACVAIDPAGALWLWGYHHTFTSSPTPKVVAYPPPGSRWVFAAISNDHSIFAILDDGSLHGVGYNTQGELGLGHTSVVRSLTRIGTDTDWKAVYPADYFTLAEKVDGSLWAAGQNARGVFGDGTTTGSTVFVPAASGMTFEKIVHGDDGPFLALTPGGELWGWGNNVWGLFPPATLAPALLDAGPWRDVAMSQTAAAAIRGGSGPDAGALYSWGYAPYAGQGKFYLSSTVPFATRVGSDADWESVHGFARSSHSVAVKSDGSVWGWGSSHDGSLGNDVQNPHKFVEAPAFAGAQTADFTPPAEVSPSPAGGLHQAPLSVTLSATDNVDPAPAIYYSVDGTAFARYTGPLSFSDSLTLRHYAVDAGGNAGPLGSTSYEVNHAPAPAAPPITVRKGRTGATVVDPGDPDAGDTHTFTLVLGPAHGTAAVDAAGTVTYTPERQFEGSDSVTVEVRDQRGGAGLAAVEVSVGVGAPPPCTDGDGDLFAAEGGDCGPLDCDDADPFANPGAAEDCADGVDNDCDGLADGADPACQPGACGLIADKSACLAESSCRWLNKEQACVAK